MTPTVVSVVIPCFNQGQFLASAIESVLAQNHGAIEIVVVDDGSTDNTSTIASGYRGVTLVRQQNRGLAAARNAGFDAGTGDYVIFLDADDVLLAGGIDAGVDCLEANRDCAFAWGRYRVRDEAGSLWEPPTTQLPRADAYPPLLRGNHITMHATVIYRRRALDSIGRFNPRLPACEDYDLYLRIARKSPIASHEHVVAEYRKHKGSMSADSPRMLEAVLAVMAAQVDYVQDNPEYLTAYADGIRFWKAFYGVRSLRRIATKLRACRLNEARRDTARLVRSAGKLHVLANAPLWLLRHWQTSQVEGKRP